MKICELQDGDIIVEFNGELFVVDPQQVTCHDTQRVSGEVAIKMVAIKTDKECVDPRGRIEIPS